MFFFLFCALHGKELLNVVMELSITGNPVKVADRLLSALNDHTFTKPLQHYFLHSTNKKDLICAKPEHCFVCLLSVDPATYKYKQPLFEC